MPNPTANSIITIPNLLTLLRIVLIPVFLVASINGEFVAAFAIFAFAAITDIADGTIARRWNLRSRLGAILDPIADKGLMITAFIYYTLAHNLPIVRIPGWLTFTVFIRDFLIMAFAYLLYTRVHVTRFPPSPLGKFSTVLQAVTMGAAIASNGFEPRFLPLALVLFKVSLVATLASAFDYLRRAERMLESAAA
jgi:cardiolipin synthase (CMP-forming)